MPKATQDVSTNPRSPTTPLSPRPPCTPRAGKFTVDPSYSSIVQRARYHLLHGDEPKPRKKPWEPQPSHQPVDQLGCRLKAPTPPEYFIENQISGITIPMYMVRPPYRECSEQEIGVIEPGLRGIPLHCTRAALRCLAKTLNHARQNTIAGTQDRSLFPRHIVAKLTNVRSDPPTHVLIVKQLPIGSNTYVFLPVHGLILAAHCSHLHGIPPPPPFPILDPSGTSLTLPGMMIEMPHPHLFNLLLDYLYTYAADVLFYKLLPPFTVTEHYRYRKSKPNSHLAKKVAEEHSTLRLMESATLVSAFKANVCQLGVYEEGLWDVIDEAWAVVRTCINLHAARKPSEDSG